MTPLFPFVARPATFILDVSVAAAWVVPSLTTSYTVLTLTRLHGTAVAVPAGFPAELAQAWREGEASGEVSAGAVDLRLSQMQGFPVHLDDGREPHVWTATVPLARRLGLPVGRAAYLELAIRLNLPLATIDPALIAAAPLVGVARFRP